MIKNRIELAEYFNKLGFKKGAEIGVATGRYSEILCQKIPGLYLWAVDPWGEYPDNWRTDESQEVAYQEAVKKLEPYNVEIMRATSLEASLAIPLDLDFVFIDGSHTFDNVMLDIILWTPKVRRGGIVAGHDYYKFRKSGVIEAITTYSKAHGIELNIIPRDDTAHRDDKVPCWRFKKK